MRCLTVLLLTLPLQGCLFFFPIPSSIWQGGNACAGEYVQVGERLKHTDGRVGKIEKVIGRHQRCQSASMPMLVDVSYDEAK